MSQRLKTVSGQALKALQNKTVRLPDLTLFYQKETKEIIKLQEFWRETYGKNLELNNIYNGRTRIRSQELHK